ncbi:DUF2256 domain-containing protein [Thermomonas sp.]|uniref:DUF2256 domain-containing protein n=1 Tax=Thermomonas sp. TaxID=1971895 RepID=UPI0035B3EF44
MNWRTRSRPSRAPVRNCAGAVHASLASAENRTEPGTGSHVHRKPHLPTKTCPVCQRPFAWRKKWERAWESVRYCSERCRRHRSGDVAR